MFFFGGFGTARKKRQLFLFGSVRNENRQHGSAEVVTVHLHSEFGV